jgi:hypothetical protein
MQLYLAFWNGDYVDHSTYGWNITEGGSIHGVPAFVPNGLQFSADGQYIRWYSDPAKTILFYDGSTYTTICWIRSDIVQTGSIVYWATGYCWDENWGTMDLMAAHTSSVHNKCPSMQYWGYRYLDATDAEKFNGDGVWHQVALCRNTTTHTNKMYIDGTVVASVAESSYILFRNDGTIFIGTAEYVPPSGTPWFPNLNHYARFTFGEWRIYSTQYTDAMVLADYNNTKTWYGL